MADLVSAAKSGNRRETLEALRGRDVAALSKRLMEVMGELDALPKPSDDDELEELQALYG